ncbi:DEAD/DEAH box helicase family protein [Microvirga soli]|uniref:DEAD/DEAH box helicase family protein n=1 Tax=Microvirga soli TaxID=1854496 RepID=UPI00191EB810|nr:DEAD/DEAH box helicase family protein [Microvirga soli]
MPPSSNPSDALSQPSVPALSRTIGDKQAEPYQARIAASVRNAIQRGRSGAVLAPTGSGKSLLAAGAAEDAVSLGKPILVLHPDVSLLRQNYAQFQAVPAVKGAQTTLVRNSDVGRVDALTSRLR